MPVNITTGNNTYAVNSSRIQKFITADNRADALRMGGWDRFKDLFRADTDKKSTKIAEIYDSIVGAPPDDRQPLAMLNRFHALKAMAATPADSAQFRTTYTPPNADQNAAPNTWGYAFSIGDSRIHEQSGVQDVHGSLGQTFEKTMLVKELEHHLAPLVEKFLQKDANRQIDQKYIDDRVSVMAARAGDDLAEKKRSLLGNNLDNPLCSRSNFKGLEPRDNGQTMVATFEKGDESLSLHFNANNNSQDPLMPCGDTLKRWLQEADYSSIRNLIQTKAKTPDDSKSVNDFKGDCLKAIQDAYAAVGKQVDAMALMNGSVQNELANMIREVHQENPESAQPLIAKLFNMSIAGFTDTDPDFAVRNILGEPFCAANGAFLESAKQVAAEALSAPIQADSVEAGEGSIQDIPSVPDLRAPKTEADNFLASHLVNYRKMNILGTEVGGGARPAGDYLQNGATQEGVLANIKAAGFTTILSIDQGDDSLDLTEPILRAGLKHEIGGQYEFPDWEHAPAGLYRDIKQFIQEKAAQGEKVFIHCGAGNGRTGATLAALTLFDLIDQETKRRVEVGKRFDQSAYLALPRLPIETEFKVLRDEEGDLEPGPGGDPVIQEKIIQHIPYIAVHAVQAVRDAVKDNPIPTGSAVETNEQLMDLAVFGYEDVLRPEPMIDPNRFA